MTLDSAGRDDGESGDDCERVAPDAPPVAGAISPGKGEAPPQIVVRSVWAMAHEQRVRAAMFVSALVVAVAACGDTDRDAAVSAGSASASSSTVSSTTLVGDDEVRPLPITGRVEPASYTTQIMEPPIEFTLTAPWDIVWGEFPDSVGFSVPTAGTAGGLEGQLATSTIFMGWLTHRFIDPWGTPWEGSAPGRESNIDAVPADVYGWLQGIEGLDVGEASTVEVGGITAQRFDIEPGAGVPTRAANACPPEFPLCVPLLSIVDDSELNLVIAGHPNRWYVVPVGSRRLLVALESTPDQLEAFTELVEPTLASLRFP